MNTELPKVVYRDFKPKQPLLMTLLTLVSVYLNYRELLLNKKIAPDQEWKDRVLSRIELLRKQYDAGIKYDENLPLKPLIPKFL